MRLKLASPFFHSSVGRRKGAKHFRLVQQLQNFSNVLLGIEEVGLDARLSLRGASPRSEEAIPSTAERKKTQGKVIFEYPRGLPRHAYGTPRNNSGGP